MKTNLLFLGSSVTFGWATNGYSFVEEIANKTEYNCIKNAVNGTTLADIEENSYVKRLYQFKEDAKVEALIVQLSTNDATLNVDLGTVSKCDNELFNLKTTVGAIEHIVNYAKKTWGCRVIFYTNPYFESQIYKNLVEQLYQITTKWDMEIIDFYNYTNVKKITMQTLQTYMFDLIHPNKKGYVWMAKIILDKINGKNRGGKHA